AMRRMGEAVFVASPADDMTESCNSLRDELQAQGYVVLPEGRLDDLFSDRAIRKEIDPAVLAIHLFGRCYDNFAERQFRLAAQTGKKLLLWISGMPGDSIESRQRVLLDSIRNGDGITAPYSLLEEVPLRKMIAGIIHLLKPGPTVEAHGNGSGPSV